MANDSSASVSQSAREHALYRSQLLADMKRRTEEAAVRAEGYEEGLVIGIAQSEQKMKNTARLLRAEGESEEKVIRYTGFSFSDLDM